MGIYRYYLEFFYTEELFLSPNVFIYSTIYLNKYELIYIYFILWVRIQCWAVYFLLELFQLWPLEALSDLLLCAPSFFLSISLLFVSMRCSKLVLYFPALESAISPGSPGCFHRRMVLRHQAWQVGDKLYFYCSLNFPLFPIRHKPHLGLAVFLTILSL